MKPRSPITLAFAFTLFLFTGVETMATEGSVQNSREEASSQITTGKVAPSIIEATPDHVSGFSDVTKDERKRLLAGIGYLYIGFLLVLFACEMSIRKEKRPEPKLYLVKR